MAEVLPLQWQRTAQVRVGVTVIIELLMKAAWVWNKLVFYWEEGATLLEGWLRARTGWPQE